MRGLGRTCRRALLALALLVAPPAAPIAGEVGDEVAQALSRPLLQGVPAGQSVRVALRPFVESELPIPASQARDLAQEVRASLLQRTGGHVQFVDDDDLRREVERLFARHGSGEAFDRAVRQILAEAKAEYELVGQIARVGEEVRVRFRLVRLRDVALLHETRALPVPAAAVAPGLEQAVPLDAALKGAVRLWLDRLPRPRQVLAPGITYADSRVATECGRYLEAALTTVLAQMAADPANAHAVDVRPLDLEPAQWRKLHGGAALTDLLPDEASFILEGRYYLGRGGVVELHLALRGRTGAMVPWRGHVLRDSIFADTCRQDTTAAPTASRLTDDFPGPFGLKLTSARGREPRYRITDPPERVEVAVSVATDAHLYCYDRDEQGRILQLLPNPWRRETRVPAGKMIVLPTDLAVDAPYAGNVMVWPVEGPPGIEIIKCFALPRPLDAAKLLGPAPAPDQPIPDLTDAKLLDGFRGAAQGQLSEASLVITVTGE